MEKSNKLKRTFMKKIIISFLLIGISATHAQSRKIVMDSEIYSVMGPLRKAVTQHTAELASKKILHEDYGASTLSAQRPMSDAEAFALLTLMSWYPEKYQFRDTLGHSNIIVMTSGLLVITMKQDSSLKATYVAPKHRQIDNGRVLIGMHGPYRVFRFPPAINVDTTLQLALKKHRAAIDSIERMAQTISSIDYRAGTWLPEKSMPLPEGLAILDRMIQQPWVFKLLEGASHPNTIITSEGAIYVGMRDDGTVEALLLREELPPDHKPRAFRFLRSFHFN